MSTAKREPRQHLVRVGFFVGLALLITAGVLLVACGGGATQNPTPPPTGAPNQLGTAMGMQVSCPASTVNPPVVGSACYSLNITCPGVAAYAADIKVSQPSGASIGTVIYTTGGGGNQLYEDQFIYGNMAINSVVAAGYTAVQTNFNDTSLGNTGWLDGPGGPLLLSCRWATAAQWVHDNIRASNTAFCATGNSGGAGVIAYALARFGQDSIFNYVLPTSGPPFTRIDYGCRCSQQTMQTTNCAGLQGTCYGTRCEHVSRSGLSQHELLQWQRHTPDCPVAGGQHSLLRRQVSVELQDSGTLHLRGPRHGIGIGAGGLVGERDHLDPLLRMRGRRSAQDRRRSGWCADDCQPPDPELPLEAARGACTQRSRGRCDDFSSTPPRFSSNPASFKRFRAVCKLFHLDRSVGKVHTLLPRAVVGGLAELSLPS